MGDGSTRRGLLGLAAATAASGLAGCVEGFEGAGPATEPAGDSPCDSLETLFDAIVAGETAPLEDTVLQYRFGDADTRRQMESGLADRSDGVSRLSVEACESETAPVASAHTLDDRVDQAGIEAFVGGIESDYGIDIVEVGVVTFDAVRETGEGGSEGEKSMSDQEAIAATLADASGWFLVELSLDWGHSTTAPQAQFTFDWQPDADPGALTVTHAGGDAIAPSRLAVVTGDGREFCRGPDWNADGDIVAGTTCTHADDDLAGRTVRVVWRDEEAAASATLDRTDLPE